MPIRHVNNKMNEANICTLSANIRKSVKSDSPYLCYCSETELKSKKMMQKTVNPLYLKAMKSVF